MYIDAKLDLCQALDNAGMTRTIKYLRRRNIPLKLWNMSNILITIGPMGNL
jgi:hypothetical protein